MSKYSPEPWVLGPSLFGETSDSLAVLDARGDHVCDFGDWPTTQERANAALIAKAPQMRTLLRQAVDQFPERPETSIDIVDWLVEFVERAHELIERS